MKNEITKLLTPGVLGFYDQVEVTAIFACLPDSTVINIFTLIVAEDRKGVGFKKEMVSKTRIKVKSRPLNDWIFGIQRYTRSITDITSDLIDLNIKSNWVASGKCLSFEDLEYQPPKFVPQDSFERVPLNNVLKNNFWNGSYILEWYDKKKLRLGCFMKQPDLLQQLSIEIQKYCPIALASVSDRLGNLVFQIPVNIIMAEFISHKQNNDLELVVAWHPKAKARNLRASCGMEYDQLINGYASYDVMDGNTLLPMNYDYGFHKGVVWDDENKVILAATCPSSFITSVQLGISIVQPEPRTFKMSCEDGEKDVRIGVHKPINSMVGSPSSNTDSWTQKRLYKDEKQQLTSNRKFVQYKPDPGKQNDEHEKALGHIRELINSYGEKGAWLWDPYLDANDVIKTLFHCSFYGAELRAITNLETYSENKKISKNKQLENQRKIFDELNSNFYGIKLEFRARMGNAGWAFHDRFLIFPETPKGALAWSLGTSVNGIGKKHHILQQVDDGQLIADAFMELWDALAGQENLLWKYP